ncbi:MAG: hypothetical protein CMJ78_07020 [Planctomycetaceae bacterium]|nr:hypothetical protein [Planctomycetaceae bacterium]
MTASTLIDRRGFMQIGALGLGGITLPQVLAAREASGNPSRDTSVIMLYQHGGATQLETYDLKPEAPSSYRSVFNPIATNVPGMDICELFPRQAALGDKISLIRSLHHEMSSHSDGGITVLTSKAPPIADPTSQSKSLHPDFGHVASHLLGIGSNAMPPYVAIPQAPYMTRPTYLGLHHGAFSVGDPNSDKFQPPQVKINTGRDGAALNERKALLKQFDQLRADLDTGGQLEGTERFRDLAFDLLTSPHVAKAFKIDDEPDTLRNKYGRNLWGQACLLARRLAEHGTPVINIYFNTPKNGQEFTNWDDHIMNAGRPGHFAKYLKLRLEYMDQALATLIEDIHAKNLNRRILVVVVGEFGRTPRLSVNISGTGRNHWPQAYTALVSGGGLKMGQVVGATNSKAEYPSQRPLGPGDLMATIYRHLGIDPATTVTDFSGRPVHIVEQGQPISELI